MKPVAIFRHVDIEGPAYFATFLEAHSIPYRVIAIDLADPIPASTDGFSGLCFMGGPMSVNDPLAWIAQECALIRDAVARNRPVIGHCLGGQLLSKALGGDITRNPVKEIGWGRARAEENPVGRHWLGAEDEVSVFQWHGETFSIPPGATRILSNAFCSNQMFALGPHLGMQCHVEMTEEMIAAWCASWPDEVAGLSPPPDSVQTLAQMMADVAAHLPAMRRLADRLYSQWIEGLAV